MATIAEVRDRAGEDLGLTRIGQGMQNQDKVRITSGYDEVYADLKDEGLATWTSTAAIPTNIVPHVVALVALNCSESYGLSDSRYARIAAKASLAKREIRKLVTPAFESLEDATDY